MLLIDRGDGRIVGYRLSEHTPGLKFEELFGKIPRGNTVKHAMRIGESPPWVKGKKLTWVTVLEDPRRGRLKRQPFA